MSEIFGLRIYEKNLGRKRPCGPGVYVRKSLAGQTSTLFTFAKSAKIIEGVDSGGMTVLPHELERITPHRVDRPQFIFSRRDNGKYRPRFVEFFVFFLARRTGTILAQHRKRVHTVMTIVPFDEKRCRSRLFDGCRRHGSSLVG